jgi:hypothetical protein
MGYDCSVTKRNGCNYCLKFKPIQLTEKGDKFNIEDIEKTLILNIKDAIYINYCPICGREL